MIGHLDGSKQAIFLLTSKKTVKLPVNLLGPMPTIFAGISQRKGAGGFEIPFLGSTSFSSVDRVLELLPHVLGGYSSEEALSGAQQCPSSIPAAEDKHRIGPQL